MKLLFCLRCQDLFKLAFEERSCKCGEVKGKYINMRDAVTNGKGVSLAISNPSLIKTVMKMSDKDCINSNQILCWCRPNEGEENPHTKVVE